MSPAMRLLSAIAVLLFAVGCSSGREAARPTVPGLAAAESDADVAASSARLTAALRAAEPVSVVADVDHQSNAASVGLHLGPTRVILFGNPALGTPLMQANPLAGLDLPQKMVIYQADGRTIVGYNATDYLDDRHGLSGVSTLSTISDALAGFARAAAGELALVVTWPASAGSGAGIVTADSPDDVPTTYARLRAAIAGNDSLTIVAELDHQANAASVGMPLPPIRLIVFGNPRLGTPLMRASQTVGVDLPQKMLVYRDAEGQTRIAYNDPFYLAERHGLGSPPEVATIQNALAALAGAASGDE